MSNGYEKLDDDIAKTVGCVSGGLGLIAIAAKGAVKSVGRFFRDQFASVDFKQMSNFYSLILDVEDYDKNENLGLLAKHEHDSEMGLMAKGFVSSTIDYFEKVAYLENVITDQSTFRRFRKEAIASSSSGREPKTTQLAVFVHDYNKIIPKINELAEYYRLDKRLDKFDPFNKQHEKAKSI